MKVYQDLTGASDQMINKSAPTPYLNEDPNDFDFENEPKGVLQPVAAKIIMKVLYGARMARYDLLHACQSLACFVSKWTFVALH